MEEIDAKQQSCGSTSAMQRLLLVLPIRHENWFDELISAMKLNGYQCLVDEINLTGTDLFVAYFLFKINHMNIFICCWLLKCSITVLVWATA